MEIAPCSHVGHLFRKSSPYSFPGGVTKVLYGNLVRVALVWMDEWKDFFFKFNPGNELTFFLSINIIDYILILYFLYGVLDSITLYTLVNFITIMIY